MPTDDEILSGLAAHVRGEFTGSRGGLSDAMDDEPVTIGKSQAVGVVLVRAETCRGWVGQGRVKFCAKHVEDCSVKGHQDSNSEALHGYYIRAPGRGEAVWADPFLDANLLPYHLSPLMAKSYSDTVWRRIFRGLTDSGREVLEGLSVEEIKEAYTGEVDFSSLKTPKRQTHAMKSVLSDDSTEYEAVASKIARIGTEPTFDALVSTMSGSWNPLFAVMFSDQDSIHAAMGRQNAPAGGQGADAAASLMALRNWIVQLIPDAATQLVDMPANAQSQGVCIRNMTVTEAAQFRIAINEMVWAADCLVNGDSAGSLMEITGEGAGRCTIIRVPHSGFI